MSWRIEHADALSMLRELPGDWAQTCVTSPPRTGAFEDTLAVLAEVHRVLRDDGTLWLFQKPSQTHQAELAGAGFRVQPVPRWVSPLATHTGVRLLLLSKQSRFFYDGLTLDRGRPPRLPCTTPPRIPRRGEMRCERELSLKLARRCVLAGSSPVACGICGAPYRRGRRGESNPGARRATCCHIDRTGCCLVLDPFCRPGTPTAEVAYGYGRSFLGITDTAPVAQRR
jgi:hypothetical protein